MKKKIILLSILFIAVILLVNGFIYFQNKSNIRSVTFSELKEALAAEDNAICTLKLEEGELTLWTLKHMFKFNLRGVFEEKGFLFNEKETEYIWKGGMIRPEGVSYAKKYLKKSIIDEQDLFGLEMWMKLLEAHELKCKFGAAEERDFRLPHEVKFTDLNKYLKEGDFEKACDVCINIKTLDKESCNEVCSQR